MSLEDAVAKLNAGDPAGCMTSLRQLAGYPAVVSQDVWVDIAEILARLAETDVPALADSALRFTNAPDDLQSIYDLGYQLFECQCHALAAAAFSRADSISPGLAPVVSELVVSLEEMGLYADAHVLLKRHDHLLDDNLLFVYLSALNGILCGQPDHARALLPRLVPREPHEHFVVARICRMLARIEHIQSATPLSSMDLRGWHHALTGGALLHLSPHGYDQAMRGRYAYVQDNLSQMRGAIDALQQLLNINAHPIAQVVLLPERGSEALGLATAAVLGLPCVDFQPGVAGLVVAHDLDRLPHPLQVALQQHSPDQLLWAHAACWTQPPICAPDITTLLYQFYTAPWDTPIATESPEPEATGNAQQLADAILAASPQLSDALPEQCIPLWNRLVQGTGYATPAIQRQSGPRDRMWLMGPVLSNRF